MLSRTLVLFAVTAGLACASAAPAGAACSSGAVDKPDLGFIDSNCDGIDGDKAAALFVAPSGDDNHSGSIDSPKRTVLAAVNAGLAAGKDVYVAAGTYPSKVPFSINGHIGVYGGYDAQTWQRSAANVTTLAAPGQVVGVGVPGILLQLLAIHSTDGSSSLSSYGVRAFGNGSVALSRVIIQTADGSKGADGAPAPPPLAPAPAGDPGIASTGGCPDHGSRGGRADDVNWGGGGGAAWDFSFAISGHIGMDDGDANPTVIAGGGGLDSGQNGGPGSAGTTGLPGMGGSAALNYTGNFFWAMPGSDGTPGTRGAGGGGGAGSGDDPCTVGGGGGAGGRPGIGGKGGKGGGGSIGVFSGAAAHVLLLDGTVIHTANGGKGGLGVAGQAGSAGGKGGKAAVSSYNAFYHSGAGGDGGYGGFGGQGGGGAGGASIGVLAIDGLAVVGSDTTITVGSGGAGGIAGNDGKPGVAQKTAQVTTPGGSVPAPGDFDGDGIADDADGCPIATGSVNGCPSPEETPTGPVAGDPTAMAAGTTTSGSGTVAVSVLPAAGCVGKRVFTIRINPRKAHIRTARLVLDGHRLKIVKRSARRWTAKADLRRSTRTRHTLTIRGKLRNGKRYKQVRRYRTCVA